MHRADFLNSMSAIVAVVPFGGNVSATPSSVAGIRIPDTALAHDAHDVAFGSEPVEIYYHSLRSFLFAELIARARKADHDEEAVYVAAILHDTGLSPKYMSDGNRFEIDGANLSREVLKRHDVTGSRAETVWDAISFHDSEFSQWKGDVPKIVADGVGADFGFYVDTMQRDEVIAVLQAAPRTNFSPVFLKAVAEIGRRKPNATGTCFVTDVAHGMVPNFAPVNFYDKIKEDPFASYHVS